MSPSRSVSQQHLFGAVSAAQRGETPASPKIAKMAHDIKPSDVKDFATTSHKGLPNHVDEQDSFSNVLEAIARYNEYGNLLQRETSLSQIAEDLSALAETTEKAIMKEGEGKYDSYDNYTIKRNLQEFTKYVSEFAKFAKEADTLEQRISALHSDMGRILERYFDVNEIANGLPTTSADTSSGPADDSAEASVRGSDVKGSLGFENLKVESEDLNELGRHTVSHPKNHAIPPVKKNMIPTENHKMSRIDELTVRAVKSVYENLKKNNPEYAKRFRALGPKRMIEVVWKLVK